MSDPRITDDAVKAVAAAIGALRQQGPDARAALEAALPHLAPQPVTSRERVAEVLRKRLEATNFTSVVHEPVRTQVIDTWADVLTGSLFAAGVFRDEGEVKAETLTEFASVLDGMAAMWATPDDYPEDWDAHHLTIRSASRVATKNAATAARAAAARAGGSNG